MLALTTYRAKRRALQAASTAAIIALPFLNILRLDIPTLRFYFFSSVLWVDEFYLLFLAMMLVLWVIIAFSMMYGRVWCGWMCPQTVINELIHGLEKRVRRRLRLPAKGGPRGRRAAAFAVVSLVVLGVALLMGFNLVSYFVDPYRTIHEIATASLGTVTTWSIVITAAVIFVDAMFWREKFCTKACPYGMMQAVVTDSKTQLVRYQTERAEECIECKACVRDCMMGIDIRVSPHQTECIHCGDCIDSCTRILGRLDTPTLISFAWGTEAKQNTWWQKLGLLDAKRWIVAGVTIAFALVLAVAVNARQPIGLTASGDRSTLYRPIDNGRIANDYVVKIANRSLEDDVFQLACPGAPADYALVIEQNPVPLLSREVRVLHVSITTTGATLHPGPNQFMLEAVSMHNSASRIATPVVFFMPEK